MSMLYPDYMQTGSEPTEQGSGKKKKKNKKTKSVLNSGPAYNQLQGGTYLDMGTPVLGGQIIDSYSTANPGNYQSPDLATVAMYSNMTAQYQYPYQMPGYNFAQDVSFYSNPGMMSYTVSGNDKKRSNNADETAPMKKKKRILPDPGIEFTPGEKVTVFIGGLTSEMEEQYLLQFLNNHNVFPDAVRKKIGRSYAHVDITNEDSFKNLKEINGENIDTGIIRLCKATTSSFITDNKTYRDVLTMFIGNIAPNVKQNQIKEIFPHQDVRLPCGVDGRHHGYAFVEFTDPETLKQAILSNQNRELEGRKLLIDYAAGKNSNNKGPSEDDKDPLNLFVGNLNESVTKDKILDLFPNSKGIRMPAYKGNYCFVSFGSAEEAKAVYDNQKDFQIDGHRLVIDYASKKKEYEKRKEKEGSGNTKVVVFKNLSFKTSEVRIRQEFPEIQHVRMQYFTGSDRSKGYCFVEFKTAEEADEAYYQINQVGKIVHGRVWVAEYGLEKGSREYRLRGKQMDQLKQEESKHWGPDGMAYQSYTNDNDNEDDWGYTEGTQIPMNEGIDFNRDYTSQNTTSYVQSNYSYNQRANQQSTHYTYNQQPRDVNTQKSSQNQFGMTGRKPRESGQAEAFGMKEMSAAQISNQPKPKKKGGRGNKGQGKASKQSVKTTNLEESMEMDQDDGMALPFSFTGRTGRI